MLFQRRKNVKSNRNANFVIILTAGMKASNTGQCAGVYPCQGEPGLLMVPNIILAMREKLLDDFKASTVIVWLTFDAEYWTEQSEMSSPMDLARFNVIELVTGTVRCRVTFVAGPDSFMCIISSTMVFYIHQNSRIS